MSGAGPADGYEQALINVVEGTKRRQLSTAACNLCRRRKQACDGRRPCRRCTDRNLICEYASGPLETPQQSTKRKHDEFSELYDLIQANDERQALQLFSQIRRGRPVAEILESARNRSDDEQNALRLRIHDFVAALTSTTSPLCDLNQVASLILRDARLVAKLPDIDAYEALRDRVTSIDILRSILAQSLANDSALALNWPTINTARLIDGFNDTPIHWVSAAPWTSACSNDSTVAHLVSTFLSLVNGYWRFLEQDVFLKAMRHGRPSRYCSPFLVNAILACASVFSEIDDAFVTPGRLLTRGLHFHEEAKRHWGSEMDRPSIASVQALFVLSMDCSIRGKDRFGLELKNQAVVMHRQLTSNPHLPNTNFTGVTASDAFRVERCLAWTALWMDFSYALGLNSSFESIESSIQDADGDAGLVLPDTVVYWTSYPLLQEPIPVRMNLLFRQRCGLNVLIADVMQLLFTQKLPDRHYLKRRVTALADAVATWRTELPDNLAYRPKMPVTLYEFHGQYLSLQMTLHSRALMLLCDSHKGTQKSTETTEYLAALRNRSLLLAQQTAQYLRDFREMYGYKITPTAVFHPAALATGILLRQIKDDEPGTDPSTGEELVTSGPASESRLSIIHASFEECFQCLLGMGMRNMLPRVIAEGIHQASKHININKFPPNVVEMLQLVSKHAWQTNDFEGMNSMYPNLLFPMRLRDGQHIEKMPHWFQRMDLMDLGVEGHAEPRVEADVVC